MKGVIELRLTKTEFEKIILNTAIGIHLANVSSPDMKDADIRLFAQLRGFAMVNGLESFFINEKDPEQPLEERLLVRMEKILENYQRVVLENMEVTKSGKVRMKQD